jgi:ceramide glucosyltransferase
VISVLLFLLVTPAAYQVMTLIAALVHLAKKDPLPSRQPPISILKPVKGLDLHFREAIRSHAVQDYPNYEIIFGVADPLDPAVPEIRRLMEEFPGRAIRLVISSTQAGNPKVGTLIDLAKEARYPVWLVNDSDVRVEAGYLNRIVGWLEQPGSGVVTCLYRATSDYWPGRWEAIGVATDFAASVLVAPYVRVRNFGLGATLLFRAEDLRATGGFEALADYLADDYFLGRRIASLGKKVVFPRLAVETSLGGRTWGEVWRHQVRWASTIRSVQGLGYLGLPFTNATLWALLALAAGAWWAALPLLALRLVVGVVVGAWVLGSKDVLRYFYLMPLRDLWGLAVWAAGLTGNTVVWRGARLRLTRDGRIDLLE